MSTVREWPHFLLRDVPENLRSQLSADADEQDISVADIVRRILCQRYELYCPPVSEHTSRLDRGGTTLLLRLQPQLKGELFLESASRKVPVRSIILDTLASHYNGKDHP